MHPYLIPGRKAIIRDDVHRLQNGISDAESYRGMVMTIESLSANGNIVFKEDPAKYFWLPEQVDPYPEEGSSTIIDSLSISSFLEAL